LIPISIILILDFGEKRVQLTSFGQIFTHIVVFPISGILTWKREKYANIDEEEGKEDEFESKKRSAKYSELAGGPMPTGPVVPHLKHEAMRPKKRHRGIVPRDTVVAPQCAGQHRVI